MDLPRPREAPPNGRREAFDLSPTLWLRFHTRGRPSALTVSHPDRHAASRTRKDHNPSRAEHRRELAGTPRGAPAHPTRGFWPFAEKTGADPQPRAATPHRSRTSPQLDTRRIAIVSDRHSSAGPTRFRHHPKPGGFVASRARGQWPRPRSTSAAAVPRREHLLQQVPSPTESYRRVMTESRNGRRRVQSVGVSTNPPRAST